MKMLLPLALTLLLAAQAMAITQEQVDAKMAAVAVAKAELAAAEPAQQGALRQNLDELERAAYSLQFSKVLQDSRGNSKADKITAALPFLLDAASRAPRGARSALFRSLRLDPTNAADAPTILKILTARLESGDLIKHHLPRRDDLIKAATATLGADAEQHIDTKGRHGT
jgi:hypothetical protein